MPEEGWKTLFVVSEGENVDVYVDGFPSGLQAPCQIYVHPSKEFVQVELRRSGWVLFRKHCDLVHPKTFVMGEAKKSRPVFA